MKYIKKITALLLSVIMIAGIMAIMPISANAAETAIRTTGADSDEIVSISAGYDMSAAVRADGSVWTWGGKNSNDRGLFIGESYGGTPTMVLNSSVKSAVVGKWLTGTGYNYRATAVLKDDKSLWMWGGSAYGVLGIGDTDSVYYSLTKVLDDVLTYDTSGYHSAAVTSNGSLYMWGRNNNGQLGDGTDENKTAPVKILDDVSFVTLGLYHSAAIKKDGSLWMWGCNYNGEVGNGTSENQFVPVKVLDNVADVSLGSAFSTAVTKDGYVYVWGSNGAGQLGLGDNNERRLPTLNENIEDFIVDIETGASHVAAISRASHLFVWGSNGKGQLGNGNITTLYEPKKLLTGIKTVSLGNAHTLALGLDGSLWSWGNNGDGQLGDRTYVDKKSRVEIKLARINASFQGDYMSENKTLDIAWDNKYLYDTSHTYNKEMAIGGLVLSEAVYNYSKAWDIFRQFGYTPIRSQFNSNNPAYMVGYRVTYEFGNPQINIIMAIRGTKPDGDDEDYITDARSIKDCFQGAADYLEDELTAAKNTIMNNLSNKGFSVTKRNTRYFITGHSLGGACAGKVGVKIIEEGSALPNNVFVYTYASPRNITDWSQKNTVPNCYNIINECDTVFPNMPTFVLPCYFPIRTGYDKYYFGTDSNSNFMNSLYQLYGEYPGDRYTFLRAHMTPIYLASLLSTEPRSEVNKVFSRARVIGVHCPVDIEVYDTEGNLKAFTKDGKTTYTGNSSITIIIDGDEKYICIPDKSNYNIKYIGTDTGNMKIEDMVYSLETGNVESEKLFEDISLEKGKLFSSSIDGSDSTENTDLYVVDEDGDKLQSVDGKGVETSLSQYDITEYDIDINVKDYKYDGTAKTQTVKVDERLTEGQDYKIVYKNNTNVGTATVTVKGINEFYGRVSKTFNIYDNGKIGDSISWEINPAGVLTLSGEGSIPDYDSDNKAPWSENSISIKKVLIENGITAVGNNSFIGCDNLSDLYIPTSVTQIGDNATDGCSELSEIHYEGTNEQWNEIIIGTNNAKITENEKTYNSEMHIHDLKKVESKEATYTDAGNTEYWVCKSCNKYYSDGEGKNEIEKDSWIIPKLVEPTEPSTSESQPTEPSSSGTNSTEPTQNENDISAWIVKGIKNKPYTGSLIKQDIEVISPEGEYAEFTTKYYNNKEVGTAKIVIKGAGEYTGTITATFKITKAKNPVTVKVSTKTIKIAKLKKKPQTVKGAITVKRAQGKVSYKLTSIPKAIKKLTKINSKGVITISKWAKAKKGTYKFKVKITAKGNKNYDLKSLTKTVTITMK